MRWYRINTNYIYNKSDDIAVATSSSCGNDKEKAIEKYFREIEKDLRCVDDIEKSINHVLTKNNYTLENYKREL